MQALEDAIHYRAGRLAAPCPRCQPGTGGRCDDHACDLDLIAGYLREARAVVAALTGAVPGPRASRSG